MPKIGESTLKRVIQTTINFGMDFTIVWEYIQFQKEKKKKIPNMTPKALLSTPLHQEGFLLHKHCNDNSFMAVINSASQC